MRKFNAGLFWVLGIALIFIFSSEYSAAQKKAAKKSPVKASLPGKEVIAKVGNEEITYDDLEKAFRKNMNRKDARLSRVSRDSINDFLNLYINYRLKVNDALGRKFDKDSSVMADINQNRKILAESFFYDKKVVEPNVNQMLKMRERELQMAIIMISLPPGPNPDTTAAYAKAKKVFDLVRSGKDFATVATDSSDDPESSKRGGLITTFITAGNVQRPVEKAIYSTKPGEIYPEIVSTRYGYFIIKLLKNEPRVKVKASQVLVAESEKDSLGVIHKADSLVKILKSGANFGRVAEENSDDPASAMKGGTLGGWYSRSTGFEGNGKHLVPGFEETLYSLKDGEISDKVKTEYGYHIIRRDSTKPFDVETEREDIKKLYKRLYYEQDKKVLNDSLRKAFGFKIDQDAMNIFASSLDSGKTTLDSNWAKKVTSQTAAKVLYRYDNKDITIQQFIDMINKKPDLRGIGTSKEALKRAIEKAVDPEIFTLATANLENEYPDFASLMKEFKDGILLFRVEAQEVWDKLKFDSVLAKSYYEDRKNKYYTSPIYDLTEIYVLTDSLAKDIYKKATAPGADFEKLAEEYTQRANFREKKGNWGKVTTKDTKLVKIVIDNDIKVGDILKPTPFEKGFSIVKVKAIDPPRQKTFEEAIPDFAPEFQDMMQKSLTEKWLEKIKSSTPVQVNKTMLEKVITEN